MRPPLRQVSNLLRCEATVSHASIPIFLCPNLLRGLTSTAILPQKRCNSRKKFSTLGHRRTPPVAVTTTSSPPLDHANAAPPQKKRALPVCCPGCGAPTQTVEPNEAGFYTAHRGPVKSYLDYDGSNRPNSKVGKADEDDIFNKAIQQADPKVLASLGLDKKALSTPAEKEQPSIPICDRCHNLIHHHTGVPIFHPTIESIKDTIAESPYNRNHIYHVIDAADFPMSLIPNLQKALHLPQLRTQNRRSKHHRWQSGDRIAEVSFIITRSDLLAPLKEQVDRLMPYMQEVLRDALGRAGRNIRLGNVHMVSAKRGWWTKEVKESIWDRGGGGWMVGKVNVGKSNLFEAVFPKGRGGQKQEGEVNIRKLRTAEERERMEAAAKSIEQLLQIQSALAKEDAEITAEIEQANIAEAKDEILDDTSLLPPPQKETPFPIMPIISALPGTTASPIRVPFGNGRGELIDLPGLARTTLDTYVRPEHRLDLVMKSRIVAQKHSIKPGQSMLLGGLIRITPTTPDLVFLAHPFVPIKPHVSSTEKAEGVQNRTRVSGIPTITEEWAGKKMKSAGKFQLIWDVTKKQTGPLTDPTAVKLKPQQLPFVVYSADILIEGCGWVELVAQVRKRKAPRDAFGQLEEEEEKEEFPEVEVFSPEGKFVGIRPPMGASVLGGPKPKARNERRARPRLSMKSLKGQRKPIATGAK
ncbi:hypothetical protein K432DRAFT_362232 [Lepidopterella palustris CBS 459.81]|uniref:Genetic interactor of prohibitins 3, mitochondrial n=1 Tax=Lepidopterella palustris CBS 459.81 TaxID=1314670 RepID=A0A8E2E175_9PEZI|nr:hypothetical protein K432DRAFT_362232 [Lepidopterella palustris CBS 459.81]